jgi:hypothetical protein
VRINPDTSVHDLDPRDSSTSLTTDAAGFVQPAIDPVTGTLYAVFEGSAFTNWAYNQVELSSSTDQGRTWSAPMLVSTPNMPAFDPFIAVNAAGEVAVSYYDLRSLSQSAPKGTLPTDAWVTVSQRGGRNFDRETRLATAFDIRSAPFDFLGWYQGLAGSGDGFRLLFVTTNPHPTPAITSVRMAQVSGDSGSTPPGHSLGVTLTGRGPDPRAASSAKS